MENKSTRRSILKYLTGAMAGVGATVASMPFIRSMSPSERAKARQYSHQEVNIEKLQPGQVLSISGISSSILILKRSSQMIEDLKLHRAKLADPDSEKSEQPEEATNLHRSLRPDLLVVENVCTHLGCGVAYSPQDESREYFSEGGFFCPCHGATYDHAGRVYKNMPATKNLKVPVYELKDENTIRLRLRQNF